MKRQGRYPFAAALRIAFSVTLGSLTSSFLSRVSQSLCSRSSVAVYVAEGQIVATSNKSPAELEAKWGSNEAGTILRRIGSEVNAHMIEFG
jgi:hypothetical protein